MKTESSIALPVAARVSPPRDGGVMRRKRWTRPVLYIVFGIIAIPFLFPTWWMITSSFKSVNEILSFPPSLIPLSPSMEAHVKAFTFQPFAHQYFNSMYIAVVVTLTTMLVSSWPSGSSSRGSRRRG